MSTASPSDTPASAPIDLARVRQLFGAPQQVADSSFLRREVAQRMRERLELVRLAPHRILDAGCGEGADLALFQQLYDSAPHVLGVDGALAMVSEARQRQQAARSAVNRLMDKWLPASLRPGQADASFACADFARLPLPANSLDLLWSNLALHWHPQPDRVFAEWWRVLQVDGLLMFSCFGPDTFKEVRAAFGALDVNAPVLPFVDMHDFGDMLMEAGFSTPVMDMEMLTVTYPDVDRLLADLRAWGGNPLRTRRTGLMGKAAWAAFRTALEQQAQADGRLSLTFEIIYGHAFRPQPRRTASGESILHFTPPPKRPAA